MMFGTLALVSYDSISLLMSQSYLGYFKSPYWIMIDGAILGAIIDYFATKHY
jgi:hypothetical protein